MKKKLIQKIRGEITTLGCLQERKMSNPNQDRPMLCFEHEMIYHQSTYFFE